MSVLNVWREALGDVEHVGIITGEDQDVHFVYDSGYQGPSISASLPIQQEPHSQSATACFFRALIPEGTAQKEFASLLHAGADDFPPYLARLNDESVGALLFSIDDARPYQNASYQKVESSFFEELSTRPLETAVATMGRTRLSLSGAMAKVGLYYDKPNGKWYFPMGAAPSTHIVKAADGKRFPLETINEALCLGIARRCGLPVASCELIPSADEPLLAVKRFDRTFEGGSRTINGLLVPSRLHQEDFCQIKSISLKYEPTDANYLALMTNATRELCVNSFGEATLLLKYTLFHYLIGNCDNHLKNYSIVYDNTWKAREIAPLYDVVSTVMYPEVYLQMGVSFGGDQRIDHVTRKRVENAAALAGVPLPIVQQLVHDLRSAIPNAIEEEADNLARQGFQEARQVAENLMAGVIERGSIFDT